MNEKLKQLFEKIGSTHRYVTNSSGAICGIEFEKSPDEKVWKKLDQFKSVYIPKRNIKVGKELYRRIKTIKFISNYDIGAEFLGKDMIIIGNRFAVPGIEKISDDIVITARCQLGDKETNMATN